MSDEVLESGTPARRNTRRLWIAIIIIAITAVIVGAARTLLKSDPTSDALRIESVELTKPATIDPNARGSGWPIKVGMPAGIDLPAAVTSVRVIGDPRRDTEVRNATSGGALSVEPVPPTLIPAGATVDVPVTVAPLDCAVTDATLDEAGYRWRRATGVQLLETTDGVVLPVSDAAQDSLAKILSELCAPAGPPPQITMVDARLDGPWRKQVLDITVTAEADDSAERILLHPLDGPGLRGIGTFSKPERPDITLMWSVAPLAEDTDGVLDALVRAITVVDDRAYPWIIRVVPPAALRSATPLRTESNG